MSSHIAYVLRNAEKTEAHLRERIEKLEAEIERLRAGAVGADVRAENVPAPPDYPEAIRTRTGQTFYLCDDGGYRLRPSASVGAPVGASDYVSSEPC